MKRPLIAAMLALAVGAAWAQQPDLAAARAALLAPMGNTAIRYCGTTKKPQPPFKFVVREREGKLFVKLASCEKELLLNAVDDIKVENCVGQVISLVYRPGDQRKTFDGNWGHGCTVELTPP